MPRFILSLLQAGIKLLLLYFIGRFGIEFKMLIELNCEVLAKVTKRS